MSEHTPGPWRVSPYHTGGLHDGPSGFYILPNRLAHVENDNAANARLIAAAPDMLEAIWQALDDMQENYCVCEQTKDQLRAAIAKAEGQS